MMDDDKQKRPLDPSDFEDDLYDDEFAFDENDPDIDLPAEDSKELADIEAELDAPDAGTEFEDTPENWGDFEDPALSATKPGQGMGSESDDAAVRKKSFLMKHFNTIVIAIGVVLGVGVVGTQMMGPLGTPSSNMPSEIASDGSETPPQPFPITPAAPQAPEEQATNQANGQEDLTPMPAQAGGNDNTQAALPPLDPGPDLGLDNVGVKEGPPADGDETETAMAQTDGAPVPPLDPATNVEKPAVELPDPIAFENQPIPTAPTPEPEPAEETPVASDPPQMAASTPEALDMTADMPPSLEETPEAPVTAGSEFDKEEPVPAVPVAPPAPVPAEPEPQETAQPADNTAQSAELEKLNADNEALNSRNKDLENEISSANAKIEELSSTLADMQKKIAAMEETSKATPEPEKTESTDVAVKEEPAAAPVAEKPQSANNLLVPAKPTKRPESEAASVAARAAAADNTPRIKTSALEAPRWVLRSAQPGRAVVSDRSTGDLRSVQVGDTLRGVGRIVSISQENGRWVVQGSQSAVRQ